MAGARKKEKSRGFLGHCHRSDGVGVLYQFYRVSDALGYAGCREETKCQRRGQVKINVTQGGNMASKSRTPLFISQTEKGSNTSQEKAKLFLFLNW
jgi:hypothetical protein